jgi:acetyl-CoA acetyltransferase
MSNEAFICDAVRTPIGRYGGVLSGVRADDLAAVPIAALCKRNPGVDWDRLDDVVLGCANQAGEDNRNVARMASLLAGLPAAIPGVTVNRLCGSGLEAVAAASRANKAGEGAFHIAAQSASRGACTAEWDSAQGKRRAGNHAGRTPAAHYHDGTVDKVEAGVPQGRQCNCRKFIRRERRCCRPHHRLKQGGEGNWAHPPRARRRCHLFRR